MLFSKRVHESTKGVVYQILPIQTVPNFSKYLGMPTVVGRSKSQMFNYLQEKIWKKLKGWKEKNISFAGREILIKAVAQAIPTYLMSSFLIPVAADSSGAALRTTRKSIGSNGKN
jgi:hypothetical protein